MDVDWVSTALHAERRINEDLRGIRLNLEGELDHLHHNSSDPHPRPIPGAWVRDIGGDAPVFRGQDSVIVAMQC